MAQFGNLSQRLNTVGQVAFLELWTQRAAQASVQRIAYRAQVTAGSGVTYGEFLTSVGTSFQALMLPMIDSTSSFRGMGVREILAPVVGSPSPAYDNSAVAVGTGVGKPMPGQVSGLIKISTAVGGRKGRGRLYIPFPAVTFGDDTDQPTAAYLVLLNALATQVLAPIVVIGGTGTAAFGLVLYHRTTGLTSPVVSTAGSPRWATQRRRGDYGRLNSSPV
jgi:hypothetical protein